MPIFTVTYDSKIKFFDAGIFLFVFSPCAPYMRKSGLPEEAFSCHFKPQDYVPAKLS